MHFSWFQVQDDKRQEVAAKEKLMKELDTIRADRTRLEDSIKVGHIPKYYAARREIITVRGQSYVSRLPKY